MIAAGANKETKTEDEAKTTPLLIAAYKGHTEIVKVLIAAGANIEAIDDEGYTPLEVAARNGHVEVVKLLLEKGAKVDFDNIELSNMFLEENFDIEEYIIENTIDNPEEWRVKYSKIKDLLVGAHWIQNVISKNFDNSASFKPFLLTFETKEVLKNIVFNTINASSGYQEISKICKNFMESKDNVITSLSIKFVEEVDLLANSKKELEDLFDEVNSEILVPLFGGYNNSKSLLPKLSMLALSSVKDYYKIFKDNKWVKSLADIAIKYKLLKHDQIEEIASALAILDIEEKANSTNTLDSLSNNSNDHLMDEPLPLYLLVDGAEDV